MLKQRIWQTMLLTDSLAGALNEGQLECDLGDLPANSIGGQLWCVVGARESYARAIAAGRWVGFSCSLGKTESRQEAAVRAALERSRAVVLDALSNENLDDDRTAIAYDVLEHEAMHQGQLVRYFYANDIAFPAEFAERYALAQPVGASA